MELTKEQEAEFKKYLEKKFSIYGRFNLQIGITMGIFFGFWLGFFVRHLEAIGVLVQR